MKAVVDRIVQYANRYQLTNVETGEVLGIFDFEEVTGTVQQVGTEIDKELFDSIANDLAARVKLSGGELAETIVTFPDISDTAANVASGDTSATLWGKVKNWFSRLKALAFKNKVAAGDFEAGAIKDADIAADAAIAQSKVSGLMTDYVASISVSGRTVTYKNKNGVNMGSITTQDTTYGLASPSSNGLMSATDKTKLDGIESGAQKNTVLGVKGSSESAYRTGNVNITKANIGLGNVDNTSDEDKPVSTATQKALNGKANTNGTYPNLTVGKATNADNATKLATARNMQVDLASGNAQSFDGSADATEIGVKGVLPVANGGTGATSLANITVGRAAADGSGNNISDTYAKLSQVARTDVLLPLDDEEFERFSSNIRRPYGKTTYYYNGWIYAVKIRNLGPGRFISSANFLVSDASVVLGLLQVKCLGSSVQGIDSDIKLKYIGFADKGVDFGAENFKAVIDSDSNTTLNIYINSYSGIGVQLLSDFHTVDMLIEFPFEKTEEPEGGVFAEYFDIHANGVVIGAEFNGKDITEDCTFIRCSGSVVIASGVTVNAIDSPSVTATGDGTLLRNGYAIGDFFIGEYSPAARAGGEWTAIAPGHTLVGSGTGSGYPVGATGGYETVTLTIEQIPNHSHEIIAQKNGITQEYTYVAASTSGNPVYLGTAFAGGGQAHTNMPPYYVTNLWQRTA